MSDVGEGHSENDDENCSTDGGFVVSPGTHDVTLELDNMDEGSIVYEVSIWVLWTAFDGDGLGAWQSDD